MKKIHFTLIFGMLIFSTVFSNAQSDEDSTGLPGDNFSLQGALELFKKAGSPEEFEKLLNVPNNDVNNLDLNGDGEVDYIKVIDKKDGDVHAFVLQVPVSETENQDIAVIELEKTGDSNAVLQIVGDEDIYGDETIVEPSEENSTSFIDNAQFGAPHGPNVLYENDLPNGIVVNVWMWPSVRFIYAPSYAIWTSPWSWRVRPVWWHTWRPLYWHAFYPRRIVYNHRYTVVATHRVIVARRMYTPVRSTSVIVRTRNQKSVTRYRTSHRTNVIERRGRNRSVREARRGARAGRRRF
jgi:hypothetical protein